VRTLWSCPNCDAQAVTYSTRLPHHNCPHIPGLMSPLIKAGVRAKVEAVEREDYIGDELVQLDANGRPIMSVITTRDDGQDCAIYAPTATGG
jgi:hypothetical protein